MSDRAARTLLLMLLSGSLRAQAVSASAPEDMLPPIAGTDASVGNALPDSPGTLLFLAPASKPQAARAAAPPGSPCLPANGSAAPSGPPGQQPCPATDPYRPFLNSKTAIPLSPRQKGYLAFRDVIDPFNLMTIGLNAGFTIGINSHTAFGPGFSGFGWYSLYSLSQDSTGEFIGTFGVCSLLHEDPHYHRMAEGKAVKRLLYAVSRTWVAQSDRGHLMPNYEKFVTYPSSAVLSNLYVPGIASNLPSTVERVAIGLASDPIDNLITEFLPDFASRLHIHVLFLQQLINQVAAGQT